MSAFELGLTLEIVIYNNKGLIILEIFISPS